MSSYLNDFLSIELQEEEQLLQSKWLRNVTSEEYREGGWFLTNLIVKHKVIYWMIDSRRISSMSFADLQWIKRDIAPILLASALRKFARVQTGDVFNYIAFENVLQKILEKHAKKLETGQFTSVESALTWLRLE